MINSDFYYLIMVYEMAVEFSIKSKGFGIKETLYSLNLDSGIYYFGSFGQSFCALGSSSVKWESSWAPPH